MDLEVERSQQPMPDSKSTQPNTAAKMSPQQEKNSGEETDDFVLRIEQGDLDLISEDKQNRQIQSENIEDTESINKLQNCSENVNTDDVDIDIVKDDFKIKQEEECQIEQESNMDIIDQELVSLLAEEEEDINQDSEHELAKLVPSKNDYSLTAYKVPKFTSDAEGKVNGEQMSGLNERLMGDAGVEESQEPRSLMTDKDESNESNSDKCATHKSLDEETKVGEIERSDIKNVDITDDSNSTSVLTTTTEVSGSSVTDESTKEAVEATGTDSHITERLEVKLSDDSPITLSVEATLPNVSPIIGCTETEELDTNPIADSIKTSGPDVVLITDNSENQRPECIEMSEIISSTDPISERSVTDASTLHKEKNFGKKCGDKRLFEEETEEVDLDTENEKQKKPKLDEKKTKKHINGFRRKLPVKEGLRLQKRSRSSSAEPEHVTHEDSPELDEASEMSETEMVLHKLTSKNIDEYFAKNPSIQVNREVFEETMMNHIVGYLAHNSETGKLRQSCRILKAEQVRFIKVINMLKKQVEDCKHIIKKLIDEKTTKQPWTENAVPLKVTRSVGLQVCTCGSITMGNVRPKENNSFKSSKGGQKNDGTHTVESTNDDLVFVSESLQTTMNSPVGRDKGNNIKATDPATPHSLSKKKPEHRLAFSGKNNENSRHSISASPINGLVSGSGKNSSTGTQMSNDSTLATQTTHHVGALPQMTNTPNAISIGDLLATTKENSPQAKIVDKPDTKVSAIIDLTEKEDQPTRRMDSHMKRPTSDRVNNREDIVTAPPNPSGANAKTANGLTNLRKPMSPITTSNGNNKRSLIGDELVTSYEALPSFPMTPKYPNPISRPPRPVLRIGKNNSGKQGIMLSWSFEGGRNPTNIGEYQLFAFQEERSNEQKKNDTWKKVGDIKALPLPMACFLTQFVEGHKYHFIVRAVDTTKMIGEFSLPGSIILESSMNNTNHTKV